MKLLLITVACLVAVCSSAIPARPMISETFCGAGEVELHEAGGTRIGGFDLCHDQTKQMEMLKADFKDKEGDVFVIQSLLRYDMTPDHMAYYLRGDEKDLHCATEKRNVTAKLMPFFDWVKLATYEGIRTVKEVEYDLWGLEVADIRFEMAVGNNKTNVPVVFNRFEPENFIKYSFNPEQFSPMIPTVDNHIFEVPKECMSPGV